MVKRGMLLVFAGLFWCTGVMLLLGFVSATYTPAGQEALAKQDALSKPDLELPYTVPGTDLVAESLAVYDGLYLEDGSCEEVSQVVALVLRNDGQAMVEQGSVTMEQGGRELAFSFRYLPPGAKVLVLDENRSLFTSGAVTSCSGHAIAMENKTPQLLTLTETGPCTLNITNAGQEVLRNICIYFKSYDPQSGMYMGGIAYQINILELAKGQTHSCRPWYYISGQSRIVDIQADLAS